MNKSIHSLEDCVICEACHDYYDIDQMVVCEDILDHSLAKIYMYFCPLCIGEAEDNA